MLYFARPFTGSGAVPASRMMYLVNLIVSDGLRSTVSTSSCLRSCSGQNERTIFLGKCFRAQDLMVDFVEKKLMRVLHHRIVIIIVFQLACHGLLTAIMM